MGWMGSVGHCSGISGSYFPLKPSDPNRTPTILVLFLHTSNWPTFCFSTAWGAALWVTFICGIIMFKNLPRHQFGNLHSKMFPAYFFMAGLCCAVSVASFTYMHPWKTASTTHKYQLGFLVAAFAFNLANLVV